MLTAYWNVTIFPAFILIGGVAPGHDVIGVVTRASAVVRGVGQRLVGQISGRDCSRVFVHVLRVPALADVTRFCPIYVALVVWAFY